MWKWIEKNKISALCILITPILLVGSFLGSVVEKHFIRPYAQVQADTVFVKKHTPCEKAVYTEIGLVSCEQKIDREFIIKMYYNQKATMTKAEIDKAYDLMAADTSFKRLIAGSR